MIGLASLSSGSKGNSTLLRHGDEAILIDCGLSFKKLKERLAQLDLKETMISAIFVTHEHSDHISGVRVAADKLGIPVYCNHNTGAAMRRKKRAPQELVFFENGGRIEHGAFIVEPFSVPHDGVDTVAYNVYCGERKLSVATDFGFACQAVTQKLKNSDIVLLESNHDVQMLQDANRPWPLKQRILGRHGHLSNESAMEILEAILHRDLKQVILAHVSEDANDYGLVADLAQQRLEQCGYGQLPMHVARQHEASAFFAL
jgi:phosphoribosyl 1,2-cyclic phosphodiesterase